MADRDCLHVRVHVRPSHLGEIILSDWDAARRRSPSIKARPLGLPITHTHMHTHMHSPHFYFLNWMHFHKRVNSFEKVCIHLCERRSHHWIYENIFQMFFPGTASPAGSQEKRSETTHNTLARRSNVLSVFVFLPKLISSQFVRKLLDSTGRNMEMLKYVSRI